MAYDTTPLTFNVVRLNGKGKQCGVVNLGGKADREQDGDAPDLKEARRREQAMATMAAWNDRYALDRGIRLAVVPGRRLP